MPELKIEESVQLQSNNTLRLPAVAKYLVQIDSVETLKNALADARLQNIPRLILGQGSNTLFTSDFEGVVFLIQTQGKEIIEETTSDILVKLAAGEDWPEFVSWAVEHDYAGVENLALIPGTLGAAPVQNIAAYGQNFSDVMVSLEAIEINTLEVKTFTNQDCQFAYRDSVFKNEAKGKYIITSVTLKLSKVANLETSYYSIGGRNDSLEKELAQIATEPYGVQDVFNAVTNIRTRKLLDWLKEPTVGSFFINPIVHKSILSQLQTKIENLQVYPADNLTYQQAQNLNQAEYVKIPAGRLIDELGWKGKTIGNCSVSSNLASILTHNGEATGEEFYNFAMKIRKDVLEHYDIELETEVNLVGG